jgi:4-alpha-glucanotransferase
MVPIAGFWSGRDIELRRGVGLIDPGNERRALDQRDIDREELLDLLANERILARGVPHSPAQLRGAVHAFVCRTPSQLAGLALDDLAGETEPVNVPGVGQAQFPSWTRKMTESLEVITASDDTATALRCDGRRGVRHA